MNELQARTIREARDSYVKFVYSKPKSHVAALYATEMADRGRTVVFGCPSTREEFVRELVELRYPRAKMNEAIHVLYHVDGITNDACEWCNPDPCPACGAIGPCEWTADLGGIVNGRHV